MILAVEKSSQKCGLLQIFLKYPPKVNNRPLGENSATLVTLEQDKEKKRKKLFS
jgi:hypothetical protein